jgi:hypothetical protein
VVGVLGRVGGREKESDSKPMDVAKDSERQIKREEAAAATTLEQEASGGRTERLKPMR